MTTNLRRRLLPLYTAAGLQGFMLWTPIEKLFMNEIGFDAATVGIMAAAYSALIPLVEVPSGMLADRWSRRGVLMLANAALLVSVLIGGLSHSVGVYILGALMLGVYFAMYSGTMDAIVYDTVLEETGSSDLFERQLGRARLVESVALVASSLAGGVARRPARHAHDVLPVASVRGARDPRAHPLPRAAPAPGDRAHPAAHPRRGDVPDGRRPGPAAAGRRARGADRADHECAVRVRPAVAGRARRRTRRLRPVLGRAGRHAGLGGLVAGRLRLDRPAALAAVITTITIASVVLTTTRNLFAVAVAQVVVMLLAVALGIHVARLLHDSVPSAVRTGVASGVSAFSWLAFLPFALVFGFVSREYGVYAAGWMITGAVALTGAALVAVARRPAEAPVAEPELVAIH